MNAFVIRDVCPVCARRDPLTLFSAPFTRPDIWAYIEEHFEHRVPKGVLDGGRYTLVECRGCGLIWQYEVLNDEFMNELYENWISLDHTVEKTRTLFNLPAQLARDVEGVAGLIRSSPTKVKILDFGAGIGMFCRMADLYGYDVTALELSPSRSKYLSQFGIRVISDLTPSQDRKYDFINTEQVFEHLAHPLEVLRRLIADFLKPGGIVKISVPNGKGMRPRIQRASTLPHGPVEPLEHINCFSSRPLRTLGERAGLRAIPEPLTVGPDPTPAKYAKALVRRWVSPHYRPVYFQQPHVT